VGCYDDRAKLSKSSFHLFAAFVSATPARLLKSHIIVQGPNTIRLPANTRATSAHSIFRCIYDCAHPIRYGKSSHSSPSVSDNTYADISLTDILTPANLNPLFTSHPELIPALFPHLPPDLPMPPSPDVLQRVTNSPQFRAAVQNFDQALRTGLLGGLVRSMGLPEEAGTSVEAFLRAIQDQAGSRQDSMDED
jgi:hypothetical protein